MLAGVDAKGVLRECGAEVIGAVPGQSTEGERAERGRRAPVSMHVPDRFGERAASASHTGGLE